MKTPKQEGFRYPAEWEPHLSTWIAWPHNGSDWPGKLSSIHWVYVEITKWLSRSETTSILVNDKDHEQRAKHFLEKSEVDQKRVEFYRYPTNRSWTRDFCPAFVVNKSEVAMSRFRFNAWANYPNWKKDDAVSDKIAKQRGYKLFPAHFEDKPVVLEGGGIDLNGTGSLLTTEECFLDKQVQVRNPQLSRKNYETIFEDYLGASNTIWLNKGIQGDDTHGHVDDICRFVNRSTVVLAYEKNAKDPNHDILEENRERLQEARLEDGSRLEVVRLPMPSPLFFDGHRLPASYANFYIANDVVLVPTFNDPKDKMVLGIFSELFPERQVVGIHAVDLVWGFGTLHCLTHEEPALVG